MKALRNLLLKVFGLEGYLRLISASYLFLVKRGAMKKKYPELFFLKNMIKPGYVCIDIGANLGYYSWFMSKHCGESGTLIAVEPVPLFGKIWHRNMKRAPFANHRLEACALGGENTRVQMATPEVNGVLHHGMTHVVKSDDEQESTRYTVEMKIPDELFAHLNRLDFIKTDVEGYEFLVFSNMIQTLQRLRPKIQTELSGHENREKVLDLLSSLNYKACVLDNGALREITREDVEMGVSDFYFLPD